MIARPRAGRLHHRPDSRLALETPHGRAHRMTRGEELEDAMAADEAGAPGNGELCSRAVKRHQILR